MLLYLKKNIWSLILLLVILGLAAYLRLHQIEGYMTFLGDEGRDVMVVRNMIVNLRPTFLGPTASVGGFFLGPIYYYFMLPFLWLWKFDPVGPAVMVALFGIATVYLVYRVGRDIFGVWAGFIAASLYALSPVVIAYNRSSWNPNLVPFFATLAMYFLWRVVVKKEWSLLFWIGVCFGIGLQLHYLFLFLFPVVGLWFLRHGRSTKYIRSYLLGVAGFVVGYAPFLLFELRHGFPNTQSIIRFITAGKETGSTFSQFVAIVTDVVYRLFGRLLVRLPQPELWDTLSAQQQVLWSGGIWAAIVAGVTLAVWWVLFAKTKEDEGVKEGARLLLIWLATVLIMFGFYRKGIYDYYFGIFFAVPFLFVGFLASQLFKTFIGRIVVLLLVSFLLWFNWQGMPFQYPPNHQLAQAKRIAKSAFEKAEGKPYNFALITQGNSDHAFRYFFEAWGNRPVTILPTEFDSEKKTITDQLIVICDLSECKPLGHPLWEIAGFGPAEIVGEWDVPFVKIFKLVHVKE